MAVRIDVEAFRESIPAAVGDAAARLLSDDTVGELEPAGGGAQAVVRDGNATFQPWVGVVEKAFVGDCDCGVDEDDFCPHAVAVALTAFDEDFVFGSAATPPSAAPVESDRAQYLEAVERLSPRQLANLVARYAVRDRLFAATLLGEAGLFRGNDKTGLDDFRAVIEEASKVTHGRRWEIAHVEEAGHRLVSEVEILCARPATEAMLDLVEEAILVWDELSGHLRDAYYLTRTDPDEISEPLVEAHRDLCERLYLDPEEISDRVNRLVGDCEHATVDATSYADLLD